MKTLKKIALSMAFIGLIVANLLILPIESKAYDEIVGGTDWKVTCNYNGQGTLISYTCESTSNRWCSCN